MKHTQCRARFFNDERIVCITVSLSFWERLKMLFGMHDLAVIVERKDLP